MYLEPFYRNAIFNSVKYKNFSVRNSSSKKKGISGTDRTSRLELFCKKGALENFAIFTGKHSCQSPLPEPQSCHLIEIETMAQVFSYEFFKIFKNIFLMKTSDLCKQKSRNRIIHRNVLQNFHCLESVRIRSFSWTAFSRIRTEYVEILHISSYLVRMLEDMDHKNSEYGYF